MDLFKLYALCRSNSKTEIYSNQTIVHYNCEMFNTLDKLNEEKQKKTPFDYKIFEINSSPIKTFAFKTSLELKIIYEDNEDNEEIE